LQTTDEQLVAETLTGSQRAYELLMSRHEKLVFKVAWTYARQRDGALDICQDVFVKAYRKLDSYRGGGSFRAWLMQITHRISMNWRRDNRRHFECVDLEQAAEPFCEATQESEVLAAEARRDLLERLDRLSERQRTALTMRYIERSPVKDIARALDCSEGVARSVLFRGLGKLRADVQTTRSGS
jgi:RNA polymerase sigma-70 factor (ECF subfamily)